MSNPLETRLHSLRTTTPPGLRERILAAGRPGSDNARPVAASRRPHRRRLLMAVAAAVLLLFGANLVALHLSPVYASRLGATPWIGPAAEALGVVPAAVVPQGQTVTADGHQVQLLGVEATPLETFVFIQIDGQPTDLAKGDPSALYAERSTLTDQFGNTYSPYGASLGVLVFAPLRGPSTLLGARMTLDINLIGHFTPAEPPNGNWSFTFDISVRPLQPLPQVRPLSVPGATCTISDLEASGRYLTFKASYVGPGVKPFGPQSPWPDFLQPTVETASGQPVPQTLVPGESSFGEVNSDPPVAYANWNGVLPSPGTYQISCAPPASGATTATITVP